MRPELEIIANSGCGTSNVQPSATVILKGRPVRIASRRASTVMLRLYSEAGNFPIFSTQLSAAGHVVNRCGERGKSTIYCEPSTNNSQLSTRRSLRELLNHSFPRLVFLHGLRTLIVIV